MRRRNFIKESLSVAGVMATTVSAVAAPSSMAGGAAFRLNYAPHEGMFAAHAGKNFVDQIKFMADQGFRSIEDNGFLGRSQSEQEQIARTLSDLKMTMGVFVVDGGDNGRGRRRAINDRGGAQAPFLPRADIDCRSLEARDLIKGAR